MTELTPREIRIKTGMTVREMADELNVPKSSYEYWESKNKFTEEIMQKVAVPKFVADFYESIKDDFEDNVYGFCLQFERDNDELNIELYEWFECRKNEPIQTLVKMKLYGYTVEQEKLYTVEIPNPNNEYCMNVLIRLPFSGKIILVALHKPNTSYLKNKEYQLTESEIKQDFDFLWQFAKEVEEWRTI